MSELLTMPNREFLAPGKPEIDALQKIPGGWFSEENHVYFDDAGHRVPGTTSLLEAAGMVCYQHIPPAILARKAEIGTAAHAAAHYFDEGDLNEGSVDPDVRGYLEAWKKFRRETDFVAQLIEFRFVGAVAGLKFGGTLDRKGILRKRRVLLEIKCCANQEASWGPQTASYDMGLQQVEGCVHGWHQRIAVWLRPNGNYRLVELAEIMDYRIFRVALQAGHEQDETKRARLLDTVKQWMASKGKVVEDANG